MSAALAHAAKTHSPAGRPVAERTRRAEPRPDAPTPAVSCPCGGGCPRCAAASRSRHDAPEAQARALSGRLLSAPRPVRRADDPHEPAHARARPGAAGSHLRSHPPMPSARAPPPARRPAVRATPAPSGLTDAGFGLSQTERERFEPLLGLDLTAVRVHAGPPAASLAAEQRAHAFAFGSHVVLGSHAQRAPPDVRAHVLAHELVHVGQQAAPAAAARPRSSQQARAPPQLLRAPLAVQRLDEDDSILPRWVSEAASTVAGAGAEALETVAEIPGRALESAAAVVEALAPGLLGLLRGGMADQLAELFCAGLDTLVGRWFAALGEIDFMAAIESTFRGLTEGVQAIRESLGGAASEALGTLLEPLVAGLDVWGGPLIRTLQDVSATVNGVLSGVWDQLAVPALGFLESVGGAIWEGFSSLVTTVWELTAPLRAGAEFAWTWLMEQFGLAWSGTADVRATLAEQAADAWTGFLATIEPIRGPLTVAAGILLLLSPLGPIVVATELIPPLWEKVTWLWQNWSTEDVLVRAQAVLRDDVLPGVIGAVGGVASALAGAYTWLAGLATQLGVAMTGVLGAFGASRCLGAVTTYLEGVAAQFARLEAWAESGFDGLVPALSAVLEALAAILRPVLDFLVRLGMVALNPGMLPLVLTAAVWLLCPDRLKPPVIVFVYDLLIAFVEAFPALLLGLGPLASVVKAGILGYLRHLRGGEGITDEVRIAVSNKVAGIAAGGGVEFIAGLALGLLHGVLDGIIDPFRLIFLIARVMVLAAGAVGRALAPFVRASVPGFAGAMEMAGAAPARAPPERTEGEPLPSAEGATDAQVAAALSPASRTELAEAASEPAVDEAALEDEARAEAASRGATVSGLAELLGDAWDFILAGAEQLGAMIAGALLRFIMQPDFELGRSLGFVAGFLLLQGLVIYFTAGGYAALKGVEPVLRQVLIYLLRFLDVGGEILGLLGRALRPLKGPLLRGLGAIRGFLDRFAFARALIERIERLAARLFRFGDEAAEAGGEAVERAGREAVEEGGERAAREAAEEAAERAAPEAVEEAAERAAREGAEEAAERTGREAGEEASERAAREAAERRAALTAAQGITRANDRVDTPVALLLAQLMALRATFRWIRRFEARPAGPPGRFTIFLIASQTPVGPYTVGEDAELDEWLDERPTRPAPTGNKRGQYQARVAGSTETRVAGGGEQVWADGVRSADRTLLDGKFAGNPRRSPFIAGSDAPQFIRDNVYEQIDDEFRRYAAVINDPDTPVDALEVITNDPRAVAYFEDLMRKHGIPGQVVVEP